jgi:hypothetical protein
MPMPYASAVIERPVDESDRRPYQDDFESAPFKFDDYVSTFRITPDPDDGGTLGEWFSTFSCDRAAAAGLTELFATTISLGGPAALKTNLESKTGKGQG